MLQLMKTLLLTWQQQIGAYGQIWAEAAHDLSFLCLYVFFHVFDVFMFLCLYVVYLFMLNFVLNLKSSSNNIRIQYVFSE